MRPLTDKELELRDRRRNGFEEFLSERMDILADFARALGLSTPPMIVNDPERYLPGIDAFMQTTAVEPKDRAWITTRLGYLVGEVLIQRLGGAWLLCEVPESKFFLRYVVGEFSAVKNSNAIADPFLVAHTLLSEPPGSSLTRLINEAERDLKNV